MKLIRKASLVNSDLFFVQVAETCQLAVQRIEWLKDKCPQENDYLRLALWVFFLFYLYDIQYNMPVDI